jgi:hypothetical protein
MQGLDSRYLNTAFYKSQSMGGKKKITDIKNREIPNCGIYGYIYKPLYLQKMAVELISS